MIVKVTTQEEFNAAVAAKNTPEISANGIYNISDAPTVRVSGSSQPRVECYDSSQPRVECYGSSQPRVECYGSSQPRVECKAHCQLAITGKAEVQATEKVQIQSDGRSTVIGGQVQIIEPIGSAKEWCDVYGVEVIDGVAILFKALGADFQSPKGGDYTPGTVPVAADWDGGKEECGGGLHFSPRAAAALAFNIGAEKFCACPVAIADIAIHPNPVHPSKIKARACCAPVWECDIDGQRVEVATASTAGEEQ